MSIVNNSYLGQMKKVQSKNKLSLSGWILGNIIGSMFYAVVVGLKSIVVYFIWNIVLAGNGFMPIGTDVAFGISAILSIVTVKYQDVSFFQMMLDVVLKGVFLYFASLLIVYY